MVFIISSTISVFVGSTWVSGRITSLRRFSLPSCESTFARLDIIERVSDVLLKISYRSFSLTVTRTGLKKSNSPLYESIVTL